MRRRFYTLDVFTNAPLAGNPLAVVLDTAGLSDEAMQRIAGEFNLAETVFVFEPRSPVNSARLRIFTPGRELPFAGHPTVGAAALIAHLREPQLLKAQDLRLGPRGKSRRGRLRRAPSRRQDLGRLFRRCPNCRMRLEGAPSAEALAAGLGLNAADIGFDWHIPSAFSAGVEFQFAPVASREAVDRANPSLTNWGENLGRAIFVYARGAAPNSFYARMFASGWGIREDPATGSAVAAFAGAVRAFETPDDGETMLTIHQGVAMGRPSLISLGIEMRGGEIVSATIGGETVIVSEGALLH